MKSRPVPSPSRRLYGVVHLPPLPGTPFHEPDTWPALRGRVAREVLAMAEGGLAGALLQTVDRVYSTEDAADAARVAAVTLLVESARTTVPEGFGLGVQIMRHAVRASLAVAKVAGAGLVRADALVGATLSTHGWVEPDPLEIMTYRRAVDAFDIELVADVGSMHFRWPDPSTATWEVAVKAVQVGADAVCVAHAEPARVAADIAEIRERAPRTLVFVGGFLDHDNAAEVLRDAHGAFVSGCLRPPGEPDRIDGDRVRRLVDVVGGLD